MSRPFNHFGAIASKDIDVEKQFRGERWRFLMMSYFRTTIDGGAGSTNLKSKMVCSVCFDVEKKDGEVEEGTDGIGGCFYFDSKGLMYKDPEYLGSIEATGAKSFKFRSADKNNWDWDQSGYWG